MKREPTRVPDDDRIRRTSGAVDRTPQGEAAVGRQDQAAGMGVVRTHRSAHGEGAGPEGLVVSPRRRRPAQGLLARARRYVPPRPRARRPPAPRPGPPSTATPVAG